MCGVAGFLHRDGGSETSLSELCDRMTSRLIHRGPDAGGIWVDSRRGVALGHRRLSIIDLTDAGAQPMLSASGRYVLSFNGEVYNFIRLKKELESTRYPFRGHSDTEVILAAVDHLGARKAIARLEGMFALALWDREEGRLTLARDRAGKKPLYYGWCEDAFLFGSELKALRAHPSFDGAIDANALGQYLQYGWVSQPSSIYKQVRKLPPGSFLEIADGAAPWSAQPVTFWSARQVAERGQSNRFTGSYDEAIDALEGLLRNAVAERMVADVDVGALLSGGVDSSLVVHLMQSLASRPVQTFSIGFWEDEYNEAHYAAEVAGYIGTKHHELYVTPDQALAVVEQLPVIYDEPFADSSQIPTFLVCQLAHENVKVVLSGDGGDEQFAGYRRYKNCLQHWKAVNRVPGALRGILGRLTGYMGEQGWAYASRHANEVESTIPRWYRKLGKLSQRSCNWPANQPQQILANKFNKCLAVDKFVRDAGASSTPLANPTYWAKVEDPLLAMLHFDYITYLPDDILVKVDRASMAVSLEARSPLLDHEVVAFAWSLPREFLFDGRNGKVILRDLLFRHVPRHLVDRPKRGFSVPIKEWLTGPLRDWVEDLVSETTLGEQGIFDVSAIRQAWAQHRRGWANHSELMWAILMFQTWWRSQA